MEPSFGPQVRELVVTVRFRCPDNILLAFRSRNSIQEHTLHLAVNSPTSPVWTSCPVLLRLPHAAISLS